jgi:poly-gamma-glutamate synthesis protein (capsule biosynthesis protein)
MDCGCRANNHALDGGIQGLADTVAGRIKASVRHAGANPDLKEAQAPAVLDLNGEKGRLIRPR